MPKSNLFVLKLSPEAGQSGNDSIIPYLTPEGLSYEDIPGRFTYPVDEQNLNQSNYEAASQAIGGSDNTLVIKGARIPGPF